MENCGIVKKSDGTVSGMEEFTCGAIFALILVPEADNQADCLNTINCIKTVLTHKEE